MSSYSPICANTRIHNLHSLVCLGSSKLTSTLSIVILTVEKFLTVSSTQSPKLLGPACPGHLFFCEVVRSVFYYANVKLKIQFSTRYESYLIIIVVCAKRPNSSITCRLCLPIFGTHRKVCEGLECPMN